LPNLISTSQKDISSSLWEVDSYQVYLCIYEDVSRNVQIQKRNIA
jgi:hypothetical protein